mmetsp:Transcript_41022/g.109705  ORF Transcript_41022/g.109705 Transcript_41022/m.109705 type:complete len:184 (-) Transcript_41022:9-560(-)
MQASQAVRADRVLSQTLLSEYEKALDRLELEQRNAEEHSRQSGVIGCDELARKKASVAAMKKAKQIQAESEESLRNSLKILEQTQQTSVETASLLKGQTEQLKDIYAGVAGLDDGLRTSNRLLAQIARRACQDRLTACLFVILVICIVGAVIVRMLFHAPAPEPWNPVPPAPASAGRAMRGAP